MIFSDYFFLLQGFSEPHDVTSDSQGASVFVADIGSNTVWKFKRRVQKIV